MERLVGSAALLQGGVVALLCSGCIAMHPTLLSTRPGQAQDIPCGVGTADFYIRNMSAIPKNIPSLLDQWGELAGTRARDLGIPGCFGTQGWMGAPRDACTWAETQRGVGGLHVLVEKSYGEKRSVGAFSLETSSGLSGTNVTLIFWHISSVVSAGAWLQGAGTAPCSQPFSWPAFPAL